MNTIVSMTFTEVGRTSRIAMIACGIRPDKTAACETCTRKADGLFRIASTGSLDALAAAICGSLRGGACAPCTEKANDILEAVTGVTV